MWRERGSRGSRTGTKWVNLGTEKAAQELLERRLRRVAFARYCRVAVAIRAAILDPLVEEAWNAHILPLFEGVHGFSERRIVSDRALERFLNFREAYAGCTSLHGYCDERTLSAANNLVCQLQKQGKYADALSILHEPLSAARRAHGGDHHLTLKLTGLLADSLANAKASPSLDDMREAIAIREDICKRSRRVYGGAHPDTQRRETALRDARRYVAHHFPEEG